MNFSRHYQARNYPVPTTPRFSPRQQNLVGAITIGDVGDFFSDVGEGAVDTLGSGFHAVVDGISDLGDFVKKIPGGDLIVNAINLGAEQLEDFARTKIGKYVLYVAATYAVGPLGYLGASVAGPLGAAAASTMYAIPGLLRCEGFNEAYVDGVMSRVSQAISIIGAQLQKEAANLSKEAAYGEAAKFVQNQLRELERLVKDYKFQLVVDQIRDRFGENIPSYKRERLAERGYTPEGLARDFNTQPLVVAQALNAFFCRNIYNVGIPIPGISEFDERGMPWSETKERETLGAARQELLGKAQALGTRITGAFYRSSPEIILNVPQSSPWVTHPANPLPSAKEVYSFAEALKSVGAQSRTIPQDPRLSAEADRLRNLYETRLGSDLPSGIFTTGTPPDVFLAFVDRADALRARANRTLKYYADHPEVIQTEPPGRSARFISENVSAAVNAERAVDNLPPMKAIPGGTSAPGDFIQAATVQMNRLCHAAYDARQIGQAPAIIASLERQCRAAGGRPMPRPTGGGRAGGSASPAARNLLPIAVVVLAAALGGAYLWSRKATAPRGNRRARTASSRR